MSPKQPIWCQVGHKFLIVPSLLFLVYIVDIGCRLVTEVAASTSEAWSKGEMPL